MTFAQQIQKTHTEKLDRQWLERERDRNPDRIKAIRNLPVEYRPNSRRHYRE